jgi:hypothetical protein
MPGDDRWQAQGIHQDGHEFVGGEFPCMAASNSREQSDELLSSPRRSI